MEIVPYGGWNRCLRLAAGNTEAILTLDVGPRIIRYGLIGGPNELVEYAKDMGKTGGDEYRSYGGHRLWIAPEEDPKTLHPDNDAVSLSQDGDWYVLTAPVEKWFVQKEIRVRVEGEALCIEHRIYNRGAYSLEFAPWALTVMAPGGTCLFPQPEFVSHSDKVLPARPMAVWHYTDMADPRWTWGRRVIRLAHDPDRGPQKLGLFVDQGYAAYANHGNLFLKRFEAEMEFEYPDFGCNFETFTRHDMLEVESLSPMQTVMPDEFAEHIETWYLVPGTAIPNEDDVCADLLESIVSVRPLIN